MARVLVTGVGGNVGQGILKALAASGVASHVVGVDANPLSVGLYSTDKGYVAPLATDPGFADFLVQVLAEEAIDIVFVGADAETLSLARMKSEIESRCKARIVVSAPEVVERCHDKRLTALWFSELGLPHPPTVLASDIPGALALAESHGWPLLVKPRKGFASRGVAVLPDEKALRAAAAAGDSAIVQTFIGSEDEEYTATVFFSDAGSPDAHLVMRRELLQGTSYRVEPCFDPALSEAVLSWASRFNHVMGPVNLQFRLTPSGPVCFEVNMRFSGTMGVRYHFGYNDAAMAVRHFVGGEPVVQPEISPGVVLRFWEELHIPGFDCAALRAAPRIVAGRPSAANK